MKRRQAILFACVTGGVLTIGAWVEARRAGAPAGFNGSTASGGRTCSDCHDGNPRLGLVEVLGAPAEYALGQRYNLRVRVADPDKLGAGFELSVEDTRGSRAGALHLSDTTRTRYAGSTSQWVTHTSAGVDDSVVQWVNNGFAYEFPVDWIAPTTDQGAVTFFAAGNAIDNDGSTVGDNVYLVQTTATRAPTDCDAILSLTPMCKDGSFKVVGKVKTTLPEGRAVLLTLDGGNTKPAVINRTGKGKALWKNVSAGSHTVCIVDCNMHCHSTTCNP